MGKPAIKMAISKIYQNKFQKNKNFHFLYPSNLIGFKF